MGLSNTLFDRQIMVLLWRGPSGEACMPSMGVNGVKIQCEQQGRKSR